MRSLFFRINCACGGIIIIGVQRRAELLGLVGAKEGRCTGEELCPCSPSDRGDKIRFFRAESHHEHRL